MSRGFVLWFTGRPAAGKTTIAKLVLDKLRQRKVNAAHLESDALRKIFTPDAVYSRKERDWFYSIIGFLATLLSEHGVNVIIDATANRRHYRDQVRRTVPIFAEIYIRCPFDICEQRDPKGIYAAARNGRTENVPGIQDPYEEPLEPALTIDADQTGPEDASEAILQYLETNSYIPRSA